MKVAPFRALTLGEDHLLNRLPVRVEMKVAPFRALTLCLFDNVSVFDPCRNEGRPF